MDDGVVILLIVVLAFAGLCLVVTLAALIFVGAGALFAWAGEWGFLGVAAYFACWVFMFPLMLVGSAVFGFLIWIGDRSTSRERTPSVISTCRMSQHGIEKLDEEPLSEYEKRRGF